MGVLQRQGILGKDDNDDAVSGIVQLLRGKNPSQVLDGIHRKVAELNTKILPPDVKVVPYLDRTELVQTRRYAPSAGPCWKAWALVVLVLILVSGQRSRLGAGRPDDSVFTALGVRADASIPTSRPTCCRSARLTLASSWMARLC